MDTMIRHPEGKRNRLVDLWTTAMTPVFDLPETVEVQAAPGLLVTYGYRQVQTPLWHVYAQKDRYLSAKHRVMGAREWQQYLATRLEAEAREERREQ
jgi:hypothetical protein